LSRRCQAFLVPNDFGLMSVHENERHNRIDDDPGCARSASVARHA
jgi:hypothetical protein